MMRTRRERSRLGPQTAVRRDDSFITRLGETGIEVLGEKSGDEMHGRIKMRLLHHQLCTVRRFGRVMGLECMGISSTGTAGLLPLVSFCLRPKV
jgi:hypothetical protein